ncbi:hypothetical protein SCB71_14250 [Herbiconiux sp. KACC 21604]|uniref:hypothetical protein n=1 Tax=unclassified Herbiconiux TaxID=2618217 RepID=UPI001491968C|nr:hypothetical protein [Herbiconiux sp. SALV-R1]QJU54303.1 hypothetical protein HL652_12190 [Herbiconiux sp. SALV-R1]WPO85373.1 hypothetical protein SCB71_14250 [Herbiconiux sp. KACC 21604]
MTVQGWLALSGSLAVAIMIAGVVCLLSGAATVVGVALVLLGFGSGAFCAGFAAARRRGVRWTDAPPRAPRR